MVENVMKKDLVGSSLKKSYKELVKYAKNSEISINITFDEFKNGYDKDKYGDEKSYLLSYYLSLQSNKNRGITSRVLGVYKWYYNTGLSLPKVPKYDKYNLLSQVKTGDIVFESNAFYGITAHVGIVEGKFYDAHLKKYYIRVIEAIPKGVVRSVLDDERVDDKEVIILRPKTSEIIMKAAVDFCGLQVGKSYSLDFQKNTSENEKNWYCSELVWASYIKNGLNLESEKPINEPGITPRDIKNSSKVFRVDISREKYYFDNEYEDESNMIFAIGSLIFVFLIGGFIWRRFKV